MTISSTSSSESVPVRNTLSEQGIVSTLPHIAEMHCGTGNHALATHFYVALKSSSKLLLVGPQESGKLAFIESMAHALVSNPSQQYKRMVGHAYWASRSRNISLLVEAQSSLNAQKLLLLLEEASQPRNSNHLFIACLARISPAEVFNIFAKSGLWQFDQSESIPIPPNFRLVGTLDSPDFSWWTPELLSNTSVLHCLKTNSASLAGCQMTHAGSKGAKAELLEAWIRNEQAAYSRLIRLLGRKQPFPLLTRTITILNEHGFYLTREIANKAVIFLANAWTKDGEGMFASSTQANLEIALELALTHYILPWARATNSPDSSVFGRIDQFIESHGLECAISPSRCNDI